MTKCGRPASGQETRTEAVSGPAPLSRMSPLRIVKHGVPAPAKAARRTCGKRTSRRGKPVTLQYVPQVRLRGLGLSRGEALSVVRLRHMVRKENQGEGPHLACQNKGLRLLGEARLADPPAADVYVFRNPTDCSSVCPSAGLVPQILFRLRYGT
jgi:hypothetical protein